MSGLESVLLLLGIFGVPIGLLVIGHRFRRLGHRMRGAFWGGVAGYAVGIVAWSIAAIAPAQMWMPGSIRLSAIVIVPALSGIAGFMLGALVGNQPKRRQHGYRRTGAALDAREHASDRPVERPSADA